MKAKKRMAALLAALLSAAAVMTGAASADSVTVTTDRLNVRAKPDAKSNVIGLADEGDELSFVSEYGSWIQVKYERETGFVTKEYVKLNRDKIKADVEANTQAWSGEGVTDERVNIRELPMTGADIVKVAKKQATVKITGVCGEWYRVKYDGETGYLMAQYVNLKSAAEATVKPEATKVPEQSEQISGEGASGVVTVRVNMRAEPTTESAILRVLGEGERISILGETGKWYKVNANGKEGYIVKTCAEITGEGETVKPVVTPRPTAAPTAKPDASGEDELYDKAKSGTATVRVNMRKTPSTSAKILRVVANGQKVTVLGENGSWYRVSLGGDEGYIARDYLKIVSGRETQPEVTAKPQATATPRPTAAPESGKTYDEAKNGKTTTRLNMRADASTGSSVVTVLPSGALLTLTGEKGDFYQAKYGSRSGYVSKAYVQLVTADQNKPEEEEKEEVRDTIYSEPKDGVTTVRVNMRRTPEGDILHTLSADTRVSIIGESGSWYKVKYANSTGYISKSYVGEKKENESSGSTSGEGTKAYITAASVNMRKGPGTGYGVIKVLKYGAEIRYYSLSDGWYLIKSGSDTGYVSSKYVSRTEPEAAPSEPEEDSGKTKVILSDWFKGEVSSVFARNDVATVTDVATGITFKVKRTGGYYHADAQPLTASDTKKMFKVYGEKWKWDRRAIWVTVDGKTYAASMNGMPHGETDSMPDNNFDGCFCIHFLNSKTHAGDRVDSAHQACVQAAYKAGN